MLGSLSREWPIPIATSPGQIPYGSSGPYGTLKQQVEDEVTRTFATAGSPAAYLDVPEFSKFVADDSARLIAAVKEIGKVEIRKKPAPHLIRGVQRFSEKIMRQK